MRRSKAARDATVEKMSYDAGEDERNSRLGCSDGRWG